jgi:hypothetical protein
MCKAQRGEATNLAVKKTFSAVRGLIPNCREVSRLQSESAGAPASLMKRVGMRLHLLVCGWCRRYGKQIRFLRAAAHDHEDELPPSLSLSAERRERMKQSLNNPN